MRAVAGECPGVVVEGVVMVVAEQHHLVDVGEPAPGREFSEVMGFAPFGWSVATWMSTPLIAGGECQELLW